MGFPREKREVVHELCPDVYPEPIADKNIHDRAVPPAFVEVWKPMFERPLEDLEGD
jgi:hypothetical protein